MKNSPLFRLPFTSAPQKPVKPKRRKKERTEMELFAAYREKLYRYGATPEELAPFDLENDFYWLFRLTDLMSKANRVFDQVNHDHFAGALTKPRIIYCDRSTGGYYNKTQHLIAISLPMTVEFGEPEFMETLLHEIAHIPVSSHSAKFYAILRQIGGTGRKAPITVLLRAKRVKYLETHYPIIVKCPGCEKQQRYKTKRALTYACRACCSKHAGGKYDPRFRFVLATAL